MWVKGQPKEMTKMVAQLLASSEAVLIYRIADDQIFLFDKDIKILKITEEKHKMSHFLTGKAN